MNKNERIRISLNSLNEEQYNTDIWSNIYGVVQDKGELEKL